MFWQTGHCHNIAGVGYHKACSCGKSHVTHGDLKALGLAQLSGIVRQRILCLCHANGNIAKAQLGYLLDSLFSLRGVHNAVCSVYLLSKYTQLFLYRQLFVVQRLIV